MKFSPFSILRHPIPCHPSIANYDSGFLAFFFCFPFAFSQNPDAIRSNYSTV